MNSVAAPWAPPVGKRDHQAGKEVHQSVAKAPGAQISLAGTGQRPGTVLGCPALTGDLERVHAPVSS